MIEVRSAVLLVASAVFAVLVCSAATSGEQASAQVSPPEPNFVFILADDMRKDDLKYMPKTRTVLGDRGMTFSKAYVSVGVCCPSRATILRGH